VNTAAAATAAAATVPKTIFLMDIPPLLSSEAQRISGEDVAYSKNLYVGGTNQWPWAFGNLVNAENIPRVEMNRSS
jgi:hypothetical protein